MIFAAYYSETARSSLFDIARVEAVDKAEAVKLATAAVKAKYPNGRVAFVTTAESGNLFPMKNADGKTCAPSEVY